MFTANNSVPEGITLKQYSQIHNTIHVKHSDVILLLSIHM